MSDIIQVNPLVFGGEGESVHANMLVKLWENPNPSVNFGAQDINFSSSDYDFLLWIYQSVTGANQPFNSTISMKGKSAWLSLTTTSGSGVSARIRSATYVNDTKFSISDGYIAIGASAQSVSNNLVIPLAVYGFKKSLDITAIVSNVSTDATRCIMSDGVTNVEDAVEEKARKTDIATVESGSTASRAYSVGELVYVNGTLYKVITAISLGSAFTVGTNIQSTTVGDTQVKRAEVTITGKTVGGNNKADLGSLTSGLPSGSKLVSWIPKSGFDTDLLLYLNGNNLLAYNINSSARTVSNGKIDVFYI